MAERLRIIYPPDPNPKTPDFTPPPGACDTHFHVFGPPDLFPYDENRVYTPPAAPFEHAMALLDVLGIERGVIVQPFAHGTDNSVTLDAVARSGGRCRGVAKVDDGFAEADLRRLHDGGIRGIRFNLFGARGGDVPIAMYGRVIERVAALGWSVTLHGLPDGLLAHADWMRGLDAPVIIDHFGRVAFADGLDQPAFRLLLELMGRDNFWVKISCAERLSTLGPPWPDAIPFARALIEVAPDRVLWGTDWPHTQRFGPGQQPNDGDLLNVMLDYAPDEAVRNRILVDNPARLFWGD